MDRPVDQLRGQLEEQKVIIKYLEKTVALANGEINDLRNTVKQQENQIKRQPTTLNQDQDQEDRVSKLKLQLELVQSERDKLIQTATIAEQEALLAQEKLKSGVKIVEDLRDQLQKTEVRYDDAQQTVQRLHRQLQAEKESHTKLQRSTSGWTPSGKDCDQDDEEVLPPSVTRPPPRPASSHQTPKKKPQDGTYAPPNLKQTQFASFPQTPKATRQNTPSSALNLPIRNATLQKLKPGPPKLVKRRRSSGDELDEEKVDESEVIELRRASQSCLPSAKKRARSTRFDILCETVDFELSAITTYNDDGTPGGHELNDLKGECKELWEHVEKLIGLGEGRRGSDWQEELMEEANKTGKVFCVRNKLRGRSSKWRTACEGKYACKDCVEQGRPCFTWNAELGQYVILPLHDSDRELPVEEDYEIRWWINERPAGETDED